MHVPILDFSMDRNVTYIGNSAFYDCTSLTSIVFEGNAPSVDSTSFLVCPAYLTAYYFPGATGFTTPTWNGLHCEPVIAPPSIIERTPNGIDGIDQINGERDLFRSDERVHGDDVRDQRERFHIGDRRMGREHSCLHAVLDADRELDVRSNDLLGPIRPGNG